MSSAPDSRRDCADWDAIADHWDAQVGEGSDFQKLLVFPATDRLLELRGGEVVLDACCGNGHHARRLAARGCRVVAFDGSARMIHHARRRHRPGSGDVVYHVADACDIDALRQALGDERFDAAVCTMALMDLPTLEPLLHAVRTSLRPGGRFVFSVAHPAFFSNEPLKWAQQDDGGETDGRPRQTFGVLVTRYLTPWPHPSRGLLGQPRAHTMYHRPLSELLGACFAAGFVVTALAEPAFPPDTRLRSPFSWARRPELPPVLVVRLQ
ncbi:MAG: class I SAM-dependent methyltransferase [Tepidisphaerales bacterium]